MDRNRREFLDEALSPWKKALGLTAIAVVLSRCGSQSSPTTPTPTPQPKPLSQVLRDMGYNLDVQCHRTYGTGIIAINSQPPGGFVITIGGNSFGEVGPGGKIDLLNWPVQPGQTVAITRVSNTPVVTPTNHC